MYRVTNHLKFRPTKVSRDDVMPAHNPKCRVVSQAAYQHKIYFVGDQKRDRKLCSQTFTRDLWRGKSRPPNAQFASGINKKSEISNEYMVVI
jgi:hypothetical protein